MKPPSKSVAFRRWHFHAFFSLTKMSGKGRSSPSSTFSFASSSGKVRATPQVKAAAPIIQTDGPLQPLSRVFMIKPKVILCDIEGTTTPITFAKDVLLPYARTNVREFLNTTWTSSQTRKDVVFLWEQYLIDERIPALGNLPKIRNFTQQEPKAANIDAICIYVNWQMDKDRKTRALQQLQGHIWQRGYDSGQLMGQVFDDVPAKFMEWTSDGIAIAIYSSSSVLEQELLFGNTTFGDLSPHITNYYDTIVGDMQSQTSYETISDLLGVPPSSILFLTDNVDQLEAAGKVGLTTALLFRGNAIRRLTAELQAKHRCIDSFTKLVFADVE